MRLAKLACTAGLIALTCGDAWAQACKFNEWGYGYYRVEQAGQLSTYLVSVRGPRWRSSSYGYHAPGFLNCETCSGGGGSAGGLCGFTEERGVARPTTSERANRRAEAVGVPYPYIGVGPDNLQHMGTREDVRIGSLSGYAILFGIVPGAHGANLSVDKLAENRRTFLALQLSDGCVSFSLDLLSERGQDGDIWSPLDSLLAEVTITRQSGAVAGPRVPPGMSHSGIVRAWPQDKPAVPETDPTPWPLRAPLR